jgi:2-C-methyl-D-erythritol 4-phosphate cytidylyltransferase
MGRVAAVVVAGGRGDRFGAPKQFLTLGDRRLVDHAVAAAGATCDAVVLVLPDGQHWDGEPVAAVVVGGPTRSASVRAGLDAVDADTEVILVHDAARPLATVGLFERVIDAVRAGADAVVPAVEVVDTLKRVDGPRVIETLPRVGLVAVQTPQGFRADALRRAHQDDDDATDDAALVEAAGGRVVVVAGEPSNLKITTVADLPLAEAILEARA